ncbi:hypothetical protein FB45DRAFT_1004645 [Roridomyces roridus]|uniref:Uncharacterized protein n=1 Tax=Roridomyces roridus TaxID=1738132 RepID=A0AAD7BQ68_9AGAR|nr:hypothetical protein FB45DRAFT_1004645 [Roridomyces roridus]
MSDNRVDPLLPSELERVIFQFAAYTEPISIPSLMLVAWRVKEWVAPLLYRVVLFARVPSALKGVHCYPHKDNSTFFRALSQKPSISKTIRHLCINDDVDLIISDCSSLEDLWGSAGASDADSLSSCPLKRLYCSLEPLFQYKGIDFQHPLFSRLTHLEIFDRGVEDDLTSWAGLASIPHLMHLAFNEEDLFPIVPDLLRLCTQLRVLVHLNAAATSWPEVSEGLKRELRFVGMRCGEYIKDWHMGALTGEDYWSRAEVFIAQRRSGSVDPLQWYIEEDASEQLL